MFTKGGMKKKSTRERERERERGPDKQSTSENKNKTKSTFLAISRVLLYPRDLELTTVDDKVSDSWCYF